MNDEKIWLETEDGQKLFIIKSEKIDMQEELNKTIETLQQELQRKDNNWNELKKYVDKLYESETYHSIGEVLDKIEELENDIK